MLLRLWRCGVNDLVARALVHTHRSLALLAHALLPQLAEMLAERSTKFDAMVAAGELPVPSFRVQEERRLAPPPANTTSAVLGRTPTASPPMNAK